MQTPPRTPLRAPSVGKACRPPGAFAGMPWRSGVPNLCSIAGFQSRTRAASKGAQHVLIVGPVVHSVLSCGYSSEMGMQRRVSRQGSLRSRRAYFGMDNLWRCPVHLQCGADQVPVFWPTHMQSIANTLRRPVVFPPAGHCYNIRCAARRGKSHE